ncbi:4F2 cell-surface antigen heavy chain-like isoform X2 [Megalops cyprinoides]|uniref:4F2 cell-surface antigen heavy chain-like isoform X2 n=1 Tax=Megalops cyprinoides TaxID=118141 RepID=UPI0018645F5E|nr:4F2 cell-surface antigen heavy chain-like isoform X2 [Megalops cyprinoides]
MSKDNEADLKDVELNDLEQEKQPMTGVDASNADGISPTGTEKNGCVKVKIPDEEESKFTGLSKKELMEVAGTPGWVRTRWALLVLFWLGWVGMLAGAIAIIVQAPRCKPLPKMNWWNHGPLYQIGDLGSFTEDKNLEGVVKKIDSLNRLKVKGLILGPIHESTADQLQGLNFLEIDSEAGNLNQFKSLLHAAHKKGISVVLDLTPNYKGREPWFANVSIADVADNLKPALMFWLGQGVDGVLLSGIDSVVSQNPLQWADIRTIVRNNTQGGNGALFGVTEKTSAVEVSNLLNTSGVDLLLSGVLRSSSNTGADCAQALQLLYSSQNQNQLAWNLGDRAQGHMASVVGPNLVPLNQMLLFTLPGTPVFNYGDEIRLEDGDTKFPKMLWDSQKSAEETNGTAKAREMWRAFFRTLSDLRGKERSLLHGDFLLLHNSTSSLAYLRQWDQSERYLAAFNWGAEPDTLNLSHPALPAQATMRVSTTGQQSESLVKLAALKLEPGQAVLLSFKMDG